MQVQYGNLIFRNGATRTYEVLFQADAVAAISAPDYAVAWMVEENSADYFAYNYLGDPQSKTITHDPVPDPDIPDSPQPDAVAMMLLTATPGVPTSLMVAFCACIKVYSAPYYTAGRIATWRAMTSQNMPDWLLPHWQANVETWCRWNAVPITP